MWRYTPRTPELSEAERQEGHEFKACLGHMTNLRLIWSVEQALVTKQRKSEVGLGEKDKKERDYRYTGTPLGAPSWMALPPPREQLS